jgi:hypothetical protein
MKPSLEWCSSDVKTRYNNERKERYNDQKQIAILFQLNVFDKPYLHQIVPKVQVPFKFIISAHANYRIFKKNISFIPTTLSGEVLRLEGLTGFFRLDCLTQA